MFKDFFCKKFKKTTQEEEPVEITTECEEINNFDLTNIDKNISIMSMEEKKCYVCNRIEELPICEDGLVKVMKSLFNHKDEKTVSDVFFEFDLAICISTHKKITPPIINLLIEFEQTYREFIKKIDYEHMQNYGFKLEKAIDDAISTVKILSDIDKQHSL
jgi:hypothetical protein